MKDYAAIKDLSSLKEYGALKEKPKKIIISSSDNDDDDYEQSSPSLGSYSASDSSISGISYDSDLSGLSASYGGKNLKSKSIYGGGFSPFSEASAYDGLSIGSGKLNCSLNFC